jgi:hypothetical protein
MELIYENSSTYAQTFVLSWADDARNNEDDWKLMEGLMTKQCDLLFGLRGGVNQSIVISKSCQKKDVFRKIKNLLKKIGMDRFLIEVGTFDRFHAEKWGWVPEFRKPATISAGSSTDIAAPQEVTPAQDVTWLGETPKTIHVYRSTSTPRQLEWLQFRAGVRGVELKKDAEGFPDFLALFNDITSYDAAGRNNRLAGAKDLWTRFSGQKLMKKALSAELQDKIDRISRGDPEEL